MKTNLLYIVIVVLVGLIYPVLSIRSGKKIKKLLLESPELKIYVYKQTAINLLVVTGLIFVALSLNHDHLETLGLSFLQTVFWLPALFLCSFLTWWLLSQMRISPSRAERLKSHFKDILYLAPLSTRQYKWAIGLSFAAGFCEEIIFRAFLFWQVNEYVPQAPAVLIVNIVFGLCHYTTGRKNAWMAFILGVLFSILYLITRSLWLPIFLHIIVDICSSTLAVKLFVEKRQDMQ